MTEEAQKRIGAFLRRKRESLAPEVLGLARTPRARTPGLRREDVAAMAGMSTVWLSKIERGKAGGISREALQSLAWVLRLDGSERQYLMTLARHDAEAIRDPCRRVSQDTQRLLDRLDPLPAILMNDYLDILAANRAYEVMCGCDLGAMPDVERNYVGLLLREPRWQRFFQVQDQATMEARLSRVVGTLRSVSATRPNDPTLKDRIDYFLGLSPIFAKAWESEIVASPAEAEFSFTHDRLGPVILRKQIWNNCNGETSGRLNVYHPLSEADYERLTDCLRSPQSPSGKAGQSSRTAPRGAQGGLAGWGGG